VLVNSLQVIYVRHAKAGSTSLMCHFNGCDQGHAKQGEEADPQGFIPLGTSMQVRHSLLVCADMLRPGRR
jgi:hypothetical protein